jgi:hypothetical protein
MKIWFNLNPKNKVLELEKIEKKNTSSEWFRSTDL